MTSRRSRAGACLDRLGLAGVAVGLAAAVAAIGSCSGGGGDTEQSARGSGITPDDVYRAQAALQPFKKDLKGALLEGLEEGPDAAILVCKSAAPAIAARHRADGVEMGRTSHKLRNPANAPAEWLKPLLERYVSGEDDPHILVSLDDGRIGYVEPIYMQKPCLMCHGENLAPAIAGRIAAEYPDDHATGFREGEFRGLFWVTVPGGSDRQ